MGGEGSPWALFGRVAAKYAAHPLAGHPKRGSACAKSLKTAQMSKLAPANARVKTSQTCALQLPSQKA